MHHEVLLLKGFTHDSLMSLWGRPGNYVQWFLMLRPLEGSVSDRLIVVENWFEELKAKSRK